MTITEGHDPDTRPAVTLSERLGRQQTTHRLTTLHLDRDRDPLPIDDLTQWQQEYQHRESQPLGASHRWYLVVGVLLVLLAAGIVALVAVVGLVVYGLFL